MSILNGQTITAADFITASAGATDAGKGVVTDSAGQIDRTFVARYVKFGGTGADGALAVSSGTTTIDLAGARVVIKQYTSISITGTGKVTFINPHANGTFIILKSVGNVTLTSSQAPMLDASGMGAIYGAGGTASGGTGQPGTAGLAIYGTGGGAGGGGNGTGGTAGPVASLANALNMSAVFYGGMYLLTGGGGGGADGGMLAGGDGGRGGGALVIECGGAWNFTTANGISVAGGAGVNGAGPGGGVPPATGGSGGGGGSFIGLYNTLTANSGTVNVAGGAVGGGGQAPITGGNYTWPASGGGGGSTVAGSAGVASTGGHSQAVGGASGVAGAVGFSIVQPNYDFA